MNKEIDYLKKIGSSIKYYRSLRKVTQTELAKKINISQSYLSRIENGKVDYNICILWEICIILEVKIYDLFPD